MNTEEKKRNTWLDLIRFSAILMVTLYHVLQRTPNLPQWAKDTYENGKYGVDLFFVLSGYLIGSIFWKDFKNNNLNIYYFWSRRLTRTLPPYFATLLITYLGVLYFRGEKFDFGYIFFIQNYYERIPYFLVSWSLCIEEHFYLLFPLLFLTTKNKKLHLLIFFSILIFTIFGRQLDNNPNSSNFGYHETATHLRLDGITIGFLIPFLREFFPVFYTKFTSCINFLNFSMLIFTLILLTYLSSIYTPYLKYLFLSLVFGIILTTSTSSNNIDLFKSKLIYFGSTTSYSIYLTQAISIDISERVTKKTETNGFIFFFVSLVIIYVLGTLFYLAIEKPTMKLRRFLTLK